MKQPQTEFKEVMGIYPVTWMGEVIKLLDYLPFIEVKLRAN